MVEYEKIHIFSVNFPRFWGIIEPAPIDHNLRRFRRKSVISSKSQEKMGAVLPAPTSTKEIVGNAAHRAYTS
jgi:hypothetical protein